MPEHPAAVTAAHLEQIMAEIQHFLEHPRIQQRRWVEKGRGWIPILQQARAHLLAQAGRSEVAQSPVQSLHRAGLEVRPRDQATWGYSWNGATLAGAYSTMTQALDAALRDQPPES